MGLLSKFTTIINLSAVCSFLLRKCLGSSAGKLFSVPTAQILYKPRVSNANADMLSRLPKDHSEEDVSGEFRIFDPSDADVYSISASGVAPRDFGPFHDSSSDGLSSVLPCPRASSLDGLSPRDNF